MRWRADGRKAAGNDVTRGLTAVGSPDITARIMSRLAPTLLLTAIAGAAYAEPPPEVVALQKALHHVIGPAEPSVACVLVSRSDKYADLGQGPPSAATGKLGEFSPIRS